ncbi:hypothetical protein SISSUDRAFT_1131751 [Sistotremastrum suecicum HHB10207 ss-3]|uniref:F-box domain-containing protein n=1 Tax=Sistotremastrum suecicum HHB10207 ss-3 TaxID=1314776 RepID=A0A165ZSD0_9AGAM|nr:hypothetical protein SISSUDRAFT_1131751 [Sistotremastrum suecicum HHB10207 ss-3]
MPFSQLPVEVHALIFEHYFADPKALVNARRWLAHTRLLCRINKYIRFLVFSPPFHEVWSRVYLQWPAKVIQWRLERSEGTALSVHLNTQECNAIKSRLKGWADFLSANMEKTRELNIALSLPQRALRGADISFFASAINTPAPLLSEFVLNLHPDARNIIVHLFASNAPRLRSASIYADPQFDLSHFPSLRQLKMLLTPNKVHELLWMLEDLHDLEELSLIGVDVDFQPHIPDQPMVQVHLPNCRSLTIKKMKSPTIKYLTSSFTMPELQRLSIHEIVVPNEYGVIKSSISEALSLLEHDTVSAHALHIALRPNHLFITSGDSSYSFSSDWSNLRNRFVSDADGGLLELAVTILSAFALQLLVSPKELIIENTLRTDNRTFARSALELVDLESLWHHVFPEYPSVETLQLVGDFSSLNRVLNSPVLHLPNLSNICVQKGSPFAETNLDNLVRFCHSRSPQIALSLPAP